MEDDVTGIGSVRLPIFVDHLMAFRVFNFDEVQKISRKLFDNVFLRLSEHVKIKNM